MWTGSKNGACSYVSFPLCCSFDSLNIDGVILRPLVAKTLKGWGRHPWGQMQNLKTCGPREGPYLATDTEIYKIGSAISPNLGYQAIFAFHEYYIKDGNF